MAHLDQADKDRHWFVAGRWQEFEGEARANLIRVAAIAAFYAVELANYRAGVPGVDARFHSTVTALAVAWVSIGWAVHMALSRRIFPERLKHLSTSADIVLLTCVLLVCDGPRSPLIACYFLVVALAALRFSLPLIRLATVGSLAGYLALLGNARWFNPALRVPRYHQAIFALALAFSGIALGQVIRRVRRFAEDYSERISHGG